MAAVTVVGLGPAGPELVTAQVAAAIGAHPHRIVRTTRHPSAFIVNDAVSCDDLYEAAGTFAEVYDAIADRVVAAAQRHGQVLYAVPGSPRVLERSVERLVADGRAEVTVLPAMSFLDLAWARLGVDPIEHGVRLVDGHLFATAAAGERGPLLVAHCHNQRVLSDIKLAADEAGDTPVVLLQRLGLPDEAVVPTTWADLDRTVPADHLTSLWIPELAAPVAVELVRFGELVATLRRECPWDSQQTHASLRRHAIEEAYEVVEAIDAFDPDTGAGAEAFEEELGDLLFQVFLHSVMASEAGWFDLADVARTVHDKLYSRHPHVFGSTTVSGAAEVLANWEVIKAAEKAAKAGPADTGGSVLDGMPLSLPALSLADKVIRKGAAAGVEIGAAPEDLQRDLRAVIDDPSDTTVGRLLFGLVARSRPAHVDPEQALRAEIRRVMDDIRTHERSARS